MATSLIKKINIATYFEILIVKLHVFYIFIMHVNHACQISCQSDIIYY